MVNKFIDTKINARRTKDMQGRGKEKTREILFSNTQTDLNNNSSLNSLFFPYFFLLLRTIMHIQVRLCV